MLLCVHACVRLCAPLTTVDDEDDNLGRWSWTFAFRTGPAIKRAMLWTTSVSKPWVCLVLLPSDKNWILLFFFCSYRYWLQSSVLLMALVWAGLVWFLPSRFWLSLWGLVVKLWQEDRRYWLSWQCGRLMCKTRDCFESFALELSMYDVYHVGICSRWYLNAICLITISVMEAVVATVTSNCRNHGLQTTVWTNSSSTILDKCSHWMQTGKGWALAECSFPHHVYLQHSCDIPIQPRNDFTGFTKSWGSTLGWLYKAVCLIERVHFRTHEEKLIKDRFDLVVFGLS